MKFSKQIFVILIIALIVPIAANGAAGKHVNSISWSNIRENAKTPWNPNPATPVIDPTAFIDPQASVIGKVTIGANVMVSPMASIRSDEGMPIFVGDNSNVQDGVVLHGLETIDEEGKPVVKNLVEVGGKNYSVYVGKNVSLAHQSQVHGPAYVGNDTFIGMQAFVFKAKVGNNCVLEPKSAAIGVTIPDGRYISAGTVITNQADAENLPVISDGYGYQKTNEAVVYVNTNLAKGYNAAVAA
jgi:carbonic anhydrase